MIVDPDGSERYRFEGYLPPDEFLAQLQLGLGKDAFSHDQWNDAERWFRAVVQRFAKTDAAPEALYWAGVAKYKAAGNPAALKETADQFAKQYPQSVWAKKASVWAG